MTSLPSLSSDGVVLTATPSDGRNISGRAVELDVGVLANALVEVSASMGQLAVRGTRPLVRVAGPVARSLLRPPVIDPRFWPETQLARIAERGRARSVRVQQTAAELAAAYVPVIANAILDRLDLTTVVRERVDLDALIADVDVDCIVAQVDIDAIAARLDVDAVAARVDVDAVAARVDVAAVVDRVDIVGISRYVVDALDVPGIVRESTGVMASETVSGVRMRAVDADEKVGKVIGRLLGRSSGQGDSSMGPGVESP